MTTPTPKRVFVVLPRPCGRGTLLDHIIRHGTAAPGQPAPSPAGTHTAPPRYDPPHASKRDHR